MHVLIMLHLYINGYTQAYILFFIPLTLHEKFLGTYRERIYMDRSYRLKMEEKLNNGVLTVDIIVSCIAKNESRINKLAYDVKKYQNFYDGINRISESKIKMDELITYRQPFIDFLMKDCHMSLDDIKQAVANVKEKNIPTKAVGDKVRNIITSGVYWIE